MAPEPYLTQDQVADLLHVSPRTLERHRVAGTGPRFMKIGARVLYDRADLKAWLSERTYSSTAEFGND